MPPTSKNPLFPSPFWRRHGRLRQNPWPFLDRRQKPLKTGVFEAERAILGLDLGSRLAGAEHGPFLEVGLLEEVLPL